MKNIYLFSTLVFTTCFAFMLIMLTSYLPFSPISVSNSTKKHLQTTLPQGWAFFTRSPIEQSLNIYQINNKTYENINFKSGDLKFIFGANKSSRMQMVELGALLNVIPDSIWLQNKGTIKDLKIIDTIPPFEIVNKSIFKSIKGLIILEKTDPLPWAWCSSKNTIKMPSQFVYLNVK